MQLSQSNGSPESEFVRHEPCENCGSSDGKSLYSGSKVKLAFYQKPYILKDGVTYGTSLKLQGIQIVTLSGAAGVDTGDLSDSDVAELFGKTQGFKAGDPNITPTPDTGEDDDF